MLNEIRELYDYQRWANQRILATASALAPDDVVRDLRSSFPSVLATLAHVASTEWIWLERWNGRSPSRPPEHWDLATLDGVTRHWADVDRDVSDFVRRLDPATLASDIQYRNTRGVPHTTPLWQQMRHVVNHSTYHRGQLVTMFRQLGAQPPATDLLLFYLERPSAQATTTTGAT